MRLNLKYNIKVFLSYAWESDDHKQWIAKLASRLRSDGLEVRLDQWDLVPGDQIPHFMERAVTDSDYVILVCTPEYKSRADNRLGGVGYEGNVITAQVLSTSNHRKFLPVLRKGAWRDAAPDWAFGKLYIDFVDDAAFDKAYSLLISAILKQHQQPPTRGEGPLISAISEEVWSVLTRVKIELPSLRAAARDYDHWLEFDDTKIASVSDGGVFEFNTSPGRHIVRLRYKFKVYWGKPGYETCNAKREFVVILKPGDNGFVISRTSRRETAFFFIHWEVDEYALIATTQA